MRNLLDIYDLKNRRIVGQFCGLVASDSRLWSFLFFFCFSLCNLAAEESSVLLKVVSQKENILTLRVPSKFDITKLSELYSVNELLADSDGMPALVKVGQRIPVESVRSAGKRVTLDLGKHGNTVNLLKLKMYALLSTDSALQPGLWCDLQVSEVESVFDDDLEGWEDVSGMWGVKNGRLVSGLAMGWHDIPMIVYPKTLNGNVDIRFDVRIEKLGKEIRCATAKDITIILAGAKDSNKAKTIAWGSRRRGGAAIYTGNAINDIRDLAKERVSQRTEIRGRGSEVRWQMAEIRGYPSASSGSPSGEKYVVKVMSAFPLAAIGLPRNRGRIRSWKPDSVKKVVKGGDVRISDGARVGQNYSVRILSVGKLTRLYVNDKLMVERTAEPLEGDLRLWLVTPESRVSFDNIEAISLPYNYCLIDGPSRYVVTASVLKRDGDSVWVKNQFGSKITSGAPVTIMDCAGDWENGMKLTPVTTGFVQELYVSAFKCKLNYPSKVKIGQICVLGKRDRVVNLSKKDLMNIHQKSFNQR